MKRTGRTQWLGPPIDQAALAGRKATIPRLVVGTASGVILIINFGVAVAAGWLVINYAAEMILWLARRKVNWTSGASHYQRLRYVLAVVLLSAIWSSATAIYWFTGLRSLQIVAIVIISAQLINAQAIASRCKTLLLANVLCPVVAMAVLPLVFGGFSGGQLVSVFLGIGLALAFVASASKTSAANAQALDDLHSEMEVMARVDTLTVVGNRRMFNEDFKRLVGLSKRQGTRFASILIDLDRFKAVNDNMGHDAGDAILVEVAARLRKVIRATDCLARLGGDEFAILMSDASDGVAIEAFCGRILKIFDEPILFNGHCLRTTPSLGVALYPDNGEDQDLIYRAADKALYDAKRAGRNTWRFYKPELAA